MGMWYGTEIITHYDRDDIEETDDSNCVIVHLSEIDNQTIATTSNNQNRNKNRDITPKIRYLKLIWNEKDTTIEYTLKFKDAQRGLWMSSSSQRLTMLDLPSNQFIGTVQVIKAIGNQLILTFCKSSGDGLLFTVIFARQPMSITADVIKIYKQINDFFNLIFLLFLRI